MKYVRLLISILIAQGAGFLGSAFTVPNIPTWYAGLAKPALNPPNWIFAPVWTTLFVLMAIAAWIVWERRAQAGAKLALMAYGAQLALNVLWSYLFFGQQNPGAAFAEIIVLWAMIVLTMVLFWRVNRWAGLLLLPYIAWVSFAAYLNFSIWQLN